MVYLPEAEIFGQKRIHLSKFPTNTFTNFKENFPPTLLLGPTFLSIFKTISLLHYYLGLLLYSELYSNSKRIGGWEFGEV